MAAAMHKYIRALGDAVDQKDGECICAIDWIADSCSDCQRGSID